MARRGGSETHRLILEFLIKGQAEKRLSTITMYLRSTNKDAQALLKTLNKLNSMTGTGRRTGAGSSATTTTRETRAMREAVKLQQDRVRLEREHARLSQTRARATGAQRTAETADLRYLRERARLEREGARATRRTSSRRRASGDYDNVDRFNRGVRTARNIGYVAERTYDMVRGGFVEPALELKRAQTRFQLLGHSQEAQARGFQAVEQVTQQLRGVRKVDATELLTNLTGTMGSVDEAVQLLPQAAKFLAATEALNGERVGRAEAIKAFSDAAKAVELMGKDINQNTAKQYLNLIAQSNLATGGEINPSEFRNFIKQGQIVGMQMSPEGLMKFMPLIQQMGGKAAGTALTSLYSSVIGGQIPAHKLKYWGEMGLLDQSKVEFNRQGRVARLLPGAIPIAEGMGQDPFLFTDKLMAAFDRKGIDTTSVDAVAKQLEVMFGNRTAKREVAQMMLMRRQLSKETENYMRVPNIESFYGQMFEQGNVLGQFLDLTASQTNARATVGGPVAAAGGQVAEFLSAQIKSLQATSAENPVTAAAMIGILSLGKASAEAADGVGIFDRVLRGGSGGGVNSEVVAGGASLIGRGAAGAAGLATNPVGFTIGATLLAGFASYKNVQAFREQLGVERGASAQLTDITQRRARGESVDYAASARSVREALMRGGELSRAEGKFTVAEFENNLYRRLARPFYGNAPLPTDKEMLQRFAPQLAVPEVRQSFMQTELPRLGLSSEGQANLQRAIEGAFANARIEVPKTANAQVDNSAFGALMKGVMGIADPAQKASEALTRPIEPAIKLAPALSNSASAAQSFADRVRRIDLRPPTFNLLNIPTGGAASPTRGTSGFTGITPPKSARGSIVKGDGLIYAHKGNVLTPANLSRRTPGDWLGDFGALRALNADKKRRNQLALLPARNADARLMPSASLARASKIRAEAVRETSYVNESSVYQQTHVTINSPPIQLTINGSIDEKVLPKLTSSLQRMLNERDRQLEEKINRGRDRRAVRLDERD